MYVKREDELGPLSIGTKIRKYLSLLPYLKKQGLTVAAVGSSRSNNILALAMLAKEARISTYFFLQQDHGDKDLGNSFFLRLLLNKEQYFAVEDGISFEKIHAKYRDRIGENVLWLPQGSSHFASLPGALTLAEDIIKNQQKLQKQFSAIFIDSGTAFTAAALVLGLGYYRINTKVFIVQLAGDDSYIPAAIADVQQMFRKLYSTEPLTCPYQILRPNKARSFGSTCRQHLSFIQAMAQDEGILLDTVYNAKLFYTAKMYIQEHKTEGNALIIHSGGTLSLTGFSRLFT